MIPIQDTMISEDLFLEVELESGIHHNNPSFMNLCKSCVAAVKHLPIITVLDYGPGTGCYSAAFSDAGYDVSYWEKFESHRKYIVEYFPHLRQLCGPISTDLMLFIEVAEHMTDKELDNLFNNISPKYILFSSTSERTPWDAAWGHINVKDQDEWLKVFENYGYKLINEPSVPTAWAKIFEYASR